MEYIFSFEGNILDEIFVRLNCC